MAEPNTFKDLLPTLPGGEASDSLASIFPNDKQLANWKPAQTRPRDYTPGGVWERAYLDTHGDISGDLRDEWRRFTEGGFYRRRNPETNLWEYQGSIPATYQTALQLDPTLAGRQTGPEWQKWRNTWEQVGGPVNQELRGRSYKDVRTNPAVAAFLERYAPDPQRQLVTPPVNAPQVVERLGRQQADRVRKAGEIHRTDLTKIATDLRNLLQQDYEPGTDEAPGQGWGARRQRLAEDYESKLAEIAERLRSPLTQAELEGTPGYQLRQAEARRATEAALAGAGLSQSGAARRALAQQASELASQEYGRESDRRRADAQAETGIRQSGFDRLYQSLLKGGQDLQDRERERAQTLGIGAQREYQAALDAINQLGRAQGSALERIVEDQDAEYERRADDYLRQLNNEQRRAALAQARAQARRQRRSARFSDILGAAATIAGTALGGPAGGAVGGALSKGLTKQANTMLSGEDARLQQLLNNPLGG